MPTHFDRDFNHLDEEELRDLTSLEEEGCVYTYLFQDDLQDFAMVRIRLRPAEIVRYVDGMHSYDEFLQGLANGLSHDQALGSVSSLPVRQQVESYNQWAASIGQQTESCPAAFLGSEIEDLICFEVPGRQEVLGATYTADRRFLLEEVLAALPEVARFLGARQASRPPYLIETEQDFRDLCFALIRPLFPDAVLEDPVPKQAGSSKRIDLVIRGIETAIELKLVRDEAHARRLADELRIDIESYHEHPHCKRLMCVIWDPHRRLLERASFMADLSGPRTKGTARFVVDVRVLP